MSRAQEPHRSFLPFGNPFKRTSPKGSYLSPRLLAILNCFEDRLTIRLTKLKPVNKNDILSLSWMKLSMDMLCETHNDIKSLISDLELPVSNWESKWIDVYLNNSMSLLDICNTFTSEISRLNQGHLILQCALLKLGAESSEQFVRSVSFLDQWKELVSSKNPKVGNYTPIMATLNEMPELSKVKNSAKGKVLMCAMYGLKIMTIAICSVFAAAFMSSSSKLIDLHVPDSLPWAKAFNDLQTSVNTEIRYQLSNGTSTVLKELEAVDTVVKTLHPLVHGNTLTKTEFFKSSISELKTKSGEFSRGLDELNKGVDSFFRVVLTSRDTLLSNIKSNSSVFGSMDKCGKYAN